MRNLILILMMLFSGDLLKGQTTIDTIYRNSYEVYEWLRLPNGMYRDSKLFSGTDYHPVSIATTGMGLIALCIADEMNWINNASELAVSTLKVVTGHDPNFKPDRTSNGYFRHFMDINTGQQAWDSEYSTIDTDILMSGALFAMKYFQDDSITLYAMELWESIDFEAAINNPATGKIYLSMNANGTGITSSLTSPYSEYMIVAWLAKNASDIANSTGDDLWDDYYQTPNILPKVTYEGYDVLSDNNSSFLSSFTHQFNYYLCNHFTTSSTYIEYLKNSYKADMAWWNKVNNIPYEWGLGAGSAITTSYQANAINNNIDTIISPHIIAGYLPIYPNGKNDLISIWNNRKGKYLLPSGNPIIWRYSKNDPTWEPNEIIGIDYATMLFGLATLPEYLGEHFFPTYNDFFSISTSTSTIHSNQDVIVYPNPSTDFIRVTESYGIISYTIYTLDSKPIQTGTISNNGEINIKSLITGMYFIQFDNGNPLKFIKE